MFHGTPRDATADRPTAFTLVELLVVIGIIALLISILLPALNNARKSAMATKCAASLREVGNSALLYATDNRGYLPPYRAGPTRTSPTAGGGQYNLGNITFGVTTSVPGASTKDPAFWFNFLAKYFTKNAGGAADAGGASNEFQRSIVWGCPAFEKFTAASGSASTEVSEWDLSFVGYGWNPQPTYTASNPAAGVFYPDETKASNNGIDNGGDPNAAAFRCFGVMSKDKFQTFGGRWFKLTNYTKASARALAGDAEFIYLQANPLPNNQAIPAQKLHYSNPIVATGANGDPTGGQTTFDWYRHGKTPPVRVLSSTGYYNWTGGKPSYNILYADGHVATVTEREEAWRSIRQRFPEPGYTIAK